MSIKPDKYFSRSLEALSCNTGYSVIRLLRNFDAEKGEVILFDDNTTRYEYAEAISIIVNLIIDNSGKTLEQQYQQQKRVLPGLTRQDIQQLSGYHQLQIRRGERVNNPPR